MNEKSICFVIPYFGRFPFWIDFFLESCRANDTINFFLISDNVKPENLPVNIDYKKMTFGEYKKLVSRQLNIEFDPVNPYKLCDLKPAYGLIHAEYLESYDFWGFCDIDLIFGNIRHFLTDTVLNKYDFFSSYDRRVSGHFFVVKNNNEGRQAFMKAKNWRSVMADPNNHCFDEKAFSDLFVRFKNHPLWSKKILTWLFLPLSRKAIFEEQYSTPGLRYNWIDDSRNFPTEWYWNKGALTNNASDRSFLYFHFLKWKRNWTGSEITLTSDNQLPEKWKITENGFESK